MTELLVLGLLKERPLSGYDIQTMLQSSNAETWGGVLAGSIYHALNKLEKNRFVEIDSIEQTGHRQKAVYRINEAGKLRLQRLISTSLCTVSVSYPTMLYSALNFTKELSAEECIAALLQQKKEIEKKVEELMKGKAEKAEYFDDKLSPISELVFEDMLSAMKRQIEFIDAAVKIIKE